MERFLMTIDRQPQLYNPAKAPNIFQISSTDPNIISFGVTILDVNTNKFVANQKYQVLPNLSGGTAFDLSSILTNLTAHYLNVSDNIVEDVSRIIKSYRMNVYENTIIDNQVYQGNSLLTDVFKVWNGNLSKVQYNSYDYNDYVMQADSGHTDTLFLTDKPNYSKLHYHSTEHLYLINKDLSGYTVTFKLYDRASHYIGLYTYTGSTYAEAIRINASPVALAEYFNIDFRPVKYFTVQIADLAGNPKTKLRFYQYEQLRCSEEPVILVFANAKGGFDSCFFLNPKESVSISRNTIERFPYGFDEARHYTNIRNNIFNKEKETIGVDCQSTYTVISQPLNDAESKYLMQLYQSPEVYVKLANGTYMPVSIVNTSYEVGRTKFSSGLVRQTLQFTAESGLEIINNAPTGDNFLLPNIPYVKIEGFCYGEDENLEFGYVEPDNAGAAIIEDGR